MSLLSSKANILAVERMKEMDEQDRLSRISTKQKLGTPVVSVIVYMCNSPAKQILMCETE